MTKPKTDKPKAKRSKPDWERVENEYRAGVLSIREIARQHEISESNIRRKAQAENWNRDLTEKVRKKVRDKLMRTQVRTPNASDNEVIEENSNIQVAVINLHRKDIAALRELEAQLVEELKNEPTKLWIGQYQGEIVKKVVGLTASERAQAANNLANVQHKRIQLERQAFNIDDDSKKPEKIDEISLNFVTPPAEAPPE